MKKVLIITYYWPPMGGGGVQRWLKFSKYLREFGWEPVIYTPLNADVANQDESLLKEVPVDMEIVKKEIWEPFELYKRFTGKSKDEKVQPGFLQESDTNSLLQEVSVWIRGNLFIPDAKKMWIKPSVRFLKSYVKENQIDAVISTGPPHSNHLIALGLKKKTGIKWLADFRDPWTNIDYYDKLKLTAWADKKHRKLEKTILKKADEVVTVSWSWARDFEKDSGRLPKVITNGYDSSDFDQVIEKTKNEKLTITHIGSLNKDRNPYSFWKALSKLKADNIVSKDNLKIKFIGPTDISVFDQIKKNGLEELCDHMAHMPHKEVISFIRQSDILLLPLNDTPNIDGVIPGKLYEYMASLRPILCIGKPDGDSAKIIKETGIGEVFDFADIQGIEKYMEQSLSDFENDNLRSPSSAPEYYSRKYLAGEIAKVLSSFIED